MMNALRFASAALVAGALVATSGVDLAAQRGRGGAPDLVAPARELAPGLYLIAGGGANSMLRVTTDGLLLVDTKNPGDEQYDGLIAAIRGVSDLPVRYVLNTQHHPDHVGNNQRFLDAGAEIVALEALREFMESDPRTTEIPGRPTRTFERDNVVRLGNAEVHQHFFGRAHTGDDTMTYFPDARIVMVSDLMTDTSPIVDWANGGSFVEWSEVLAGVLDLDFETAIQGRGEPKSRADVEAFKATVDTVIARAREAIAGGATRDDLGSEVRTDDLEGWTLNDQFFTNLHDELTTVRPG